VSTSFARVRVDAFGGGMVGVSLADRRVLGGAARNDVAGVDLVASLPAGLVGSASTSHSLTRWTDGDRWGHRTAASVVRPSGDGVGFQVEGEAASRDYRVETGFAPQAGYQQAAASVDYTVEPEGAVDTVVPRLELSVRSERSGDRALWAEAGTAVLVGGVHEVEAQAEAFHLVEAGAELPIGGAGSLRYAGTPGRAVTLEVEAGGGRTLDYAALVPAAAVGVGGSVTLRPTDGLRFDTTALGLWLWPDGREVAREVQVRERIGLVVSNTLSLRVIEQLQLSGEPSLSSSFLVSWVLHPGTELHAGAAEVHQLGAGGGVLEELVFVKVSGRLRL
jgi:hypothetical protein